MTDTSATADAASIDKTKQLHAGVRDAYRQVLLCVFMGVLVLIVMLALSALYSTIFTTTILAGALGAFFSSLLRLYRFDSLPRAILEGGLSSGNVYLVIHSLVPLLVGAIGAAALYVAFAAKFLEGSLLPTFECRPGAACTSFSSFVQDYRPNKPEGFAKALIWGFLAGFSERLVPDLLKRFDDRPQPGTRESPPPSA